MLYTRRLLPLLLRTVVTGLLVPVIVDILWGCSKPSGLRCPVFAARDGARLQKTDRIPLALSQFSLRATARPCENWSAAPAVAPCFVHWTRSPLLPLLRFGCFCRRQRLSCAALRPLDIPPALRARPHTGALNHRLLPLILSRRLLCSCQTACK